MDFLPALIRWYREYQRALPWRETSDPYAIWVSEVILQQTRMAQGMEYYLRFLRRFPNVQSLAAAREEEVLKIWQGLGYYSRARNMHAAARQIVLERNGVFPPSFRELQTLKGVGLYTAAAVASIAFREPVPAVDGNVNRVLARLFGIEEPLLTPGFVQRVWALATSLTDPVRPDLSNQAWMELGALVCTPRQPDCLSCPLQPGCVACARGIQERLPVRLPKTGVRPRYLHYLVLSLQDSVFLRRRPQGDIWQGLFEFPLVETSQMADLAGLMQHPEVSGWFDSQPWRVQGQPVCYRHRLTHQLLHVWFYEVKLTRMPRLPDEYIMVSRSSLDDYAIPRLIDKYLTEL